MESSGKTYDFKLFIYCLSESEMQGSLGTAFFPTTESPFPRYSRWIFLESSCALRCLKHHPIEQSSRSSNKFTWFSWFGGKQIFFLKEEKNGKKVENQTYVYKRCKLKHCSPLLAVVFVASMIQPKQEKDANSKM